MDEQLVREIVREELTAALSLETKEQQAEKVCIDGHTVVAGVKDAIFSSGHGNPEDGKSKICTGCGELNKIDYNYCTVCRHPF